MTETVAYYFGGLLVCVVLIKLAGWFLFPEANPIDELADEKRKQNAVRKDKG